MNTPKNRRGKSIWLLAVVSWLILLLGALPPEAKAQTTTRVSVDSNGIEGNAHSGLLHTFFADISGDARYVAFPSEATNLVPGDTNGFQDIFVHDRNTGQTIRVSIDSTGNQSNGNSSNPAISANGRYIFFESEASNLVPGDTNGKSDGFVHDRQIGQTTRISVSSGGKQGDANSSGSGLTPDGRYVLFNSEATNLVDGVTDTDGFWDVFIHDRQTRQTTRVSVSSSGTQGNSFSSGGGISDDGRYVSFTSIADNLVPGDTNGAWDVFIHDRQTGQTTRVVNDNGTQGDSHSIFSSMSVDGRFVPFLSHASNFVPGDTNGGTFNTDVFVHDRQTGQTTRVSVDSNGVEANGSSGGIFISENNRYVIFTSEAGNLVPGDTNGAWDVFVHDRQTGETSRVSVNSNGEEPNGVSQGGAASRDGRFISFVSNATNLVDGDTNGVEDVFIHDRGPSTARKTNQADLDGNGTSDLLWRNTKNGNTAIWLLNGDTIGSTGFPGGVPLAWQIAGIGDVNGDGKADVIWRHTTSATVAIWLMNGATITSVGFPASVPTAWSLQGVGDVNGDGQADLVWRNTNDGNAAIWLMNGTRIASSGFLGKVPLAWQLAGVGDADADGKADLIWRNGTSHAVAVWLMNGLTMTSSGFPGNVSPDLQIAGVGDVNGDSKADLVWRNTNSGDVEVWLLNGTTMASSGSLDGLSSRWQIAQVGDANGDGKADVIWYDTTSGAVMSWLLNGLTISSKVFPGTASPDWIIAGQAIRPPLHTTTIPTLPVGTVRQAYNVSVGISGGTPPFTWNVFSGSLTPGRTLHPPTGIISLASRPPQGNPYVRFAYGIREPLRSRHRNYSASPSMSLPPRFQRTAEEK